MYSQDILLDDNIIYLSLFLPIAHAVHLVLLIFTQTPYASNFVEPADNEIHKVKCCAHVESLKKEI